eukprot:21281-Heterococcus_DN1.PRE.6
MSARMHITAISFAKQWSITVNSSSAAQLCCITIYAILTQKKNITQYRRHHRYAVPCSFTLYLRHQCIPATATSIGRTEYRSNVGLAPINAYCDDIHMLSRLQVTISSRSSHKAIVRATTGTYTVTEQDN